MNNNCTKNDDENKEISVMKSEDNFQFGNEIYRDLAEAFFSSYASSTFEKLNILVGDNFEKKDTLIISELQNNFKNFKIIGEISNISDYNSENVILSFYEKGNDNLKNVSCSIKNLGNNKYQLDCFPETTIKGNISGVIGKTNDEKTLVFINKNNDINDYVNVIVNGSSIIKKENGGLSGGAISGIIIACFVFLFVSVLAISFHCTKKAKVPLNASEMEMYNSSITHA